MEIPSHVSTIIQKLNDHGYEAYAVGGCVRDALLHRVPQDWDITTSAKPQEVKALFSHTIDTGIQHGTVTVMLDHVGYEVTTYRIDGEYQDSRHPKEVTFTGDLLEDLKRRDFTINAMAYSDEGGLVDAFQGQEDLKKGIIRCVGDPMERFKEDALRMLRAVRFSAQLGFEIEERTAEAIRRLAPTIGKVSAERIQVELTKMLTSNHPEAIGTAYELGLTAVFLPEFDVMMETPQNNHHHCYSVGEHTIRSLREVSNDKVLRLTMLLHDVAKPLTITTDEEGQDHYYGHPELGATKAREILKRLKWDNDTIDRVTRLIRYHDDRPPLSEKNVRRAMNRVGLEQFPDLFEVKRADVLAQGEYKRPEKLSYIDEYQKYYEQILEKNQCVSLKNLAVNGKDLIELGMKPGKELGEVLQHLFELVLENPQENTRENLLEKAHKMK